VATSKADKDLIATARERYRLAEEAEREIRREAKIDLEVAAGNQWDDADKAQRNAMARAQSSRVSFNKLTYPCMQVVNQARMNAGLGRRQSIRLATPIPPT
jgi:hypothetical protein